MIAINVESNILQWLLLWGDWNSMIINFQCESRPTTPQSDSTESADTYVEDDPNDPEWTVNESTMERIPFKR